MDKKLKIAVIGGDERQVRLACLLNNDGHSVSVFALEKAALPCELTQIKDICELSEGYDCVALPIPVKADGELLNAPFSDAKHPITELFSHFATRQTIIAGKADNLLFAAAGRSGLRLYDYLEREDFTVMNSALTAEAAVSVAMNERKSGLNGTKCLVIGFGHIGKLLSHYLRGLGASVTATARKSGDLSWISAYGYFPCDTSAIRGNISQFDLIFNTVPALVLDEKTLAATKDGVFVCDLASSPGGVDFSAAGRLGIKTCHALSLPGRLTPVSAAAAMKQTIYNILDEWGI